MVMNSFAIIIIIVIVTIITIGVAMAIVYDVLRITIMLQEELVYIRIVCYYCITAFFTVLCSLVVILWIPSLFCSSKWLWRCESVIFVSGIELKGRHCRNMPLARHTGTKYGLWGLKVILSKWTEGFRVIVAR